MRFQLLVQLCGRLDDSVENADCVILDINMNDGSGIELRNGIKAAAVSVSVIYMTGIDSPAVRKAALDPGCAAFPGSHSPRIS